jgi:CubicO group peptidase (beta-lactamase class C family)
MDSRNMDMDYIGKAVLVTGSTSGIGEACARLFAEGGASVMISGRDEERGRRIARSLAGGAANDRFIAADLRTPGACEGLIAETAGQGDATAGPCPRAAVDMQGARGGRYGLSAGKDWETLIRNVVTLILGFLFATQLFGADQATDAVSMFVRAEMRRQHIPGLTLLVSRSGKPIRTEGYGLCNLELKVPVKPETIFQSGSVGKQFTATAVMMLVEAGKVGLDDPLTQYFPDAPPSWSRVTVRELLSHTAGFTDYPKDFDERKDYTEEELLRIVEAIPLAYPPGTSWTYSNLGYLTLGILIHKVTGQILRRLSAAKNLQTARDVNYAHHQ